MSKHTPITMEDLGLTPGEAEMFASGARHLFGADPESNEPEPVQKPIAKPAPKRGALAKVSLGSGASPGKSPVAKKGKVVA